MLNNEETADFRKDHEVSKTHGSTFTQFVQNIK